MHRLLTTLFFTITIPVLLQAGFVIDQTLNDTLTTRALANLEPLPEEIATVYSSYISENPDGIMAYLIGAERSAVLWDADPQDLMSNYRQIQLLLQREDFDCSPEFFLAYIAKITIGNEKITPYREVLAQLGLLNLQAEYPDMMERVRAVNLWCRENMTIVSTSGRTQDPLSVAQKSHIGRCGEMQVFFSSACRTVGIPARPAWTPWWPHTDNNHAWTEVFVEGKWHYVGSAEPSYHTNSTWFTRSVNKALLILARSSFPDSLDDVVSASTSISYVNSTRYYQPVRNVAFSVIDMDNNPVADAAINIMAFNFSLLRTLLAIETDSCGRVKLDIGQGGFIAVAFKDTLFDYVRVPFDSSGTPTSYTLRIRERRWENEDFRLEYPAGIGERPVEPEQFTKRKKQAAERYNELINNIQSQAIPDWAPAADSNFVQLFKEARNNKQPLLNLVAIHSEIPADFWVKALLVDVKFYWQANLLQWEQLYNIYRDLAGEEPAEDAWSSLLNPSIYYEQLPRVRVPAKYVTGHGLPVTERTAVVLNVIHAHHEIEKEKAPKGLLSLDNLIASPYLQDFQFKILSCYVLRANHIPTQYTRIPSTVMVLADSVWQNYDVAENSFVKPQDTSAGTLVTVEFNLQDEDGLPVTLNPDNISTTLFQEGRFYYNDRQLEYDSENSRLTGELEQGDFQVQICIRESGEVTQVKLVALQLVDTTAVRDTLRFQDFQRNWRPAKKKQIDFLATFIDPDSSDLMLLLGDYDNEPVQRLATKVRSRLTDQRFIWVGGNQPAIAVPDYNVINEYTDFLVDNPELKHRLITYYYDGEADKWFMFEGIWDLLYK
ncbi:transglutaminase-like domain-containing protein [bacterium]|nr:transglutaminase-like domain-containing protein [bacterium]